MTQLKTRKKDASFTVLLLLLRSTPYTHPIYLIHPSIHTPYGAPLRASLLTHTNWTGFFSVW